MTADGMTYERQYILQWLQNHNTSPMTGLPLPNKGVTMNYALRSLIDDFIRRHRKES